MKDRDWLDRKATYRCKHCGEVKSYGFLTIHLKNEHDIKPTLSQMFFQENYTKVLGER